MFNLEDYGLEGEMLEKAKKDYQADIDGLKKKNADLIELNNKLKQDSEALTLEMATKEEDAKIALAEKEGTVEQYKNAVAERDQKLETVQREFKEAENARILDNAISDFSVGLTDDPAGRMYMQKQFKDSVEVVDGVLKPKDPTIDAEALKQKLVEDKANAKYIKATVGAGGGSQGGQSGFNQVKAPKDMNEHERALFKQQDPEGFKKAFNLNR